MHDFSVALGGLAETRCSVCVCVCDEAAGNKSDWIKLYVYGYWSNVDV